ncbi:hypothetical protein [Aliiglaciecola lipolytica]|nr:hypothetical protein [Aliiglaciecola lipolytica]
MINELYNKIVTFLTETFGSNFILLIVTTTTVASLAYFVAIGYLITQMDKYYFVRKTATDSDDMDELQIGATKKSVAFVLQIAKIVVGVFLIVLGVSLLVLPGQGLITIIIGVSLIPFPGKSRVERNLLSRKSVRKSLNWIRTKAKKEPFVFD